jgi:hypothetical protein
MIMTVAVCSPPGFARRFFELKKQAAGRKLGGFR